MADTVDRIVELWGQGGFVMPFLALCLIGLWYGLGYRLMTVRTSTINRAKALLERAKVTSEDKAIELLAPIRADLDRHRTLVKSITLVAPLAGLLGTVTGMIETFDSLGSMTMFSRGGGIGQGIGEALVSTQMGLVVAVPGMLLGVLIDRRQESYDDELDELADTCRSAKWAS